MRKAPILVLALTLTLTACRSAYIEATISNRTGQSLSLVELDYPSASFGTETIAPGQDFHYRFKVLGQGPTTLLWTDAAHHDHKDTGPTLHENQQGRLTIVVQPTGPVWKPQLSR